MTVCFHRYISVDYCQSDIPVGCTYMEVLAGCIIIPYYQVVHELTILYTIESELIGHR